MEHMHRLADEIRETFEERGCRIAQAVQLDQAFSNTRRPQSSLGRALVLEAIQEATSRIGLGLKSVSGGGCDVVDFVDNSDRQFRVRKADLDPDTGYYDIIAGSDSILITDAEPDSLILSERWVLGYTVDDDGMIVDIFAAKVLGITEHSVPRLTLGPTTLLGAGSCGATPPGAGFKPADEDDLGDGLDFGDVADGGQPSAM
ncbi:hypothetical protein [Mycolicibacterium sp.]|uniref:hypothetical protein n=1 Tax=Mycolicibacterium sp. TaxID=2320850 RepID=UPI0028B020DE|nr:hypothetical protein [Mycolicibacterium sp.]